MNKNKITAVLGPTNTGKTHLAIETMLSFENGMIGFPLRLLAREVYDKVIKKIGLDKVALITGEEKIIPPSDITSKPPPSPIATFVKMTQRDDNEADLDDDLVDDSDSDYDVADDDEE